jgi:sarcosine oxidase
VERVDVVVVGAGGAGAAAAWQLAARGRSVVLLERFEAGHVRGSSHGATRIFRVAYRDRRYTDLASAAIPLWRQLEDETGARLLDQTGQLDHGFTSAVDEIEGNLRDAGWAAERLSPQAAHERWPGMRFGDAVVFSPDGGRCYADAAVAALAQAAAAHGAEVRYETPAERIELHDDGATVHTPAGAWTCDRVVVAAGPWVDKLVGGQITLPPLEITMEQPAHFRPTVAVDEWPSFIHHVVDEGSGETPLGFGGYGLLTPGEGVKVGEHGTGQRVDPDTRSFDPEPSRVARLQRYVAAWLPGLDPDPVSVLTCLYTSTPDEHFVLDRRGPLVVASPCSGHGFKFVPAIGALVADLALGGEQHDPAWRLP